MTAAQQVLLSYPPPPISVATTWNPSDKSTNVTLSNGNLTYLKTAAATHDGTCRATISKATGKWYWEVLIVNIAGGNSESAGGIANSSAPLTNYVGSDANGWGYLGVNGLSYHSVTKPEGAVYVQEP